MKKTIEGSEKEIIDEFSFFEDWTDRYQYLIELGQKLNGFPKEKMVDDYKIRGCQSSLWVVPDMKEGKVYFTADSDSTIVKGLIALLIRVLSGQSPEDIINAKLEFIDKIGLRKHLAQTRTNGLSAMIKQIRLYALAYKMKEEVRG
jgi:cysteine desulfuration protein SufE